MKTKIGKQLSCQHFYSQVSFTEWLYLGWRRDGKTIDRQKEKVDKTVDKQKHKMKIPWKVTTKKLTVL